MTEGRPKKQGFVMDLYWRENRYSVLAARHGAFGATFSLTPGTTKVHVFI